MSQEGLPAAPDAWSLLAEVREPAPGRLEAEVRLPPDSPWFEGHFPGNPIFPGLGLLALADEALRRGLGLAPGAWVLGGVKRVRFRKALRPGAVLGLRLRVTRGEGSIRGEFEFVEGGDDVGRGVLELVPAGLTGSEDSG